MNKSKRTVETTSNEGSITLRNQLLKSHLNVALLGMFFLVALVLLGYWYNSKLNQFYGNYWPTTQTLLLLEDGVHRSTAYLHQGISLRNRIYLTERENIWDTSIRPALQKLKTLVALDKADVIDTQKKNLEKLSLLLPQLESTQWQIADIALTEGNTPAILILEREFTHGVNILLRQIDALRLSSQGYQPPEGSLAIESLLSGLAEKIKACHLNMSISIYAKRKNMDRGIVECQNTLAAMQESLILAAPTFNGVSSALYKEYIREFDAYMSLSAHLMSIGESKLRDIALSQLSDVATPLTDEIDLLLNSVSQTYLNRVQLELDYINRTAFYSAGAVPVAIILLALLAIALSRRSADRIGSPVTALAKMTKDMIAMADQETPPIPIQGVRELRDLIGSFNHFQNALVKRNKQLRESQIYYQSIIKNSVDPVIVISKLGIIELFNGAASKVFGYTREEAISQNVSILVPKNIRSEHDGYLENYVKTGKAKIIGIGRKVEAVRKDGSYFPIHLALSEIRLSSGTQHFVGVIHDLSKQKKMETELMQAHKLEAVGQLAAGIAHEINTPVQFVNDNITFLNSAFEDILSLLGLYEQLAACIDKKHDTSALMAEIRAKVEAADLEFLLEEIPNAASQSLEGTNRIGVIVRAMKEFSHPGTKSKELVDINHAIETTIIIASNEWKYVAQVKTDFDVNLPSINVCLTEINQTVLNMIVNAAHAIAERHQIENLSNLGEINISTRKRQNKVEIRIADTGYGIPAEIVTKIFTPFFTTKELGKGTGQGLAIAYKAIVEGHNGEIKVDSDIGKGTTFTILLPISEPKPVNIEEGVA